MEKDIVFATNNAHKLAEVRNMVGRNVKILSLADIGCHTDIPETASTLEGNAAMKADYVHTHYHTDCFADDTGLEVAVLNGKPGVHSARYAYNDRQDAQANVKKLLKEMQDAENRTAQFRTVVCLILNGEKHFFEGIIKGSITINQRGTGGFGYDSVFIPDGYEQTFGEMAAEMKNKISHRALAIEKLNQFLSILS